MQLRHYQTAAVNAVFEEWKDHVSTLIVMPTGTGKTQVFSEVIRRAHPKRAIVLVHRSELLWQAVKRIESFGLECSVEMADLRASNSFWNQTPVVVSTIQTQCAGNNGQGRMLKFDPMEFGVVIVDEAHHATSETWVRTLNHYKQNKNIRILGVTATPDRASEEPLGQVFESVAYDYELLDAIHDGYLVPIEQQMVEIEGLDFSAIRTTAGDLNGAELAEVMEAEKPLHGVADATMQIIGERKAVVFTVSVKQAEMLSEIFNRHKQGTAGWVCGKTPTENRRRTLEDFAKGDLQIVVNVGVLTEGWDSPSCGVIVQARPTKSRSLYAQMVGRATRPLPGTVDGDDMDTAEKRRAAIARSAKPSMLVVDFCGNSGRHKLMTTADILGANVSDEAIERATKRAKASDKPVRMAQLLEEEEQRIREEIERRKQMEAARKAKLVGKATFSVRKIDPFSTFDMMPARARGWDEGKKLSPKQEALLLRNGIDPSDMPYAQAKQLLNTLFYRWNNKLASLKQCDILKKRKIQFDPNTITQEQASKMIDAIAAREGWGKKKVSA